ncbi:MAG: UTP--glucose-1-phosphate uridylyltransferase GalU [Acidimicrobiales bacterium]
MSPSVRKAVIPAAGLGTRFLPATKSQPKEMLPLVDKPAIQYVVEEAVAAGIRDVLVVTGRGKTTLEDHFDRSFELERSLEASGKLEQLAEVRRIAEMADVHYVRQGEPKGLGHAVSMASRHVGDEPFAVMLGDDIMDEQVGVLRGMLDAYGRLGSPVIALKRVPAAEISSYGCARVRPAGDGLVQILELVEKPSRDEAPSDLAVMGRYVFGPSLFGALGEVRPGRGGELQLTDAVSLLMRDEPVYGYVFEEGRWDTGNKLDWLRATVELALRRPELADPFREVLTRLMATGPGVGDTDGGGSP